MPEWYRGTGLRPYLAQLCPEDARRFEADVLAGLRQLYAPEKDGQIVFLPAAVFYGCKTLKRRAAAGLSTMDRRITYENIGN